MLQEGVRSASKTQTLVARDLSLFLFSAKLTHMSYELRDPIHTRITFDAFERSLIDHPFFQRLRFISQLSYLQTLVYPGALHNRFTHCLGAMHIAGRLFGRCFGESSALHGLFDEEALASLRQRLRTAALLHDLGHGPFSHETESLFPDFLDLPLDQSWFKNVSARQSTHEDYSVLLIQTLAKEGVLEAAFAQDVASLIHAQVSPSASFAQFTAQVPNLHALLKGLISSELDADRMDYLLRDSYYCGVVYGHYDIDWLISSMQIVKTDGVYVFVLSENGVRAFESFLLARYHMLDQVYFHKTKVGFLHYLEESINTGEVALEIPTDPYAYARLRDDTLIELLFAAAQNPEHYYAQHLMQRIPAKRLLRLHQMRWEDQQTLCSLTTLCETNGIRYFTHSVASSLSAFGEGKTGNDQIRVARKTRTGYAYVPIFDYSDLLQKYNEQLAFTDFFILPEDVEAYQQTL